MRGGYVACLPLGDDWPFWTRQDRIEIAEFLIERVLRTTFDCPSFALEERHKLVLDRFYTVTLTAFLSRLRVNSKQASANGPFTLADGIVNLSPRFFQCRDFEYVPQL